MFRIKYFGLVLLFILFCFACNTIPLASPELDQEAKSFIPPHGMSNLYFARIPELGGSALVFTIFVDGNPIGSIGTGTFHMLSVKPGHHTVLITEGGSAQAKIDAEADKNYFFDIGSTWGFTRGGPLVKQISESEGMALVNKCKRVESLQ